MKLVVLGANGRTGRLVVQEALAAGDTITAVVRSDDKRLGIRHSNLRVAVGDPCDPTFLVTIFEGQDAVVSALGGRSPTRRATSIYWKSADAIADAAVTSGLRKIAVTSSALLFPRKRLADRLLAALVPNVVQSAARMEETLQRTSRDVIIVRCGFLTNSDERRYRAELGSLPRDGSTVPRLSLARFLVDTIHETSAGNQVYGVSGPA